MPIKSFFKAVIFALVVVFPLAGCTTTHQQNYNSTDLHDLLSIVRLAGQPKNENAINPIRAKALREAALTCGAQGALANRSAQIDAMLNKSGKFLTQNYNFNGLMLDNDVLPPVIEKGGKALNLQSAQTIRISDKTYRILKPARFVTAAPTWQEYLIMNYKKPALPDKTLWPRSTAEQEIWIKYILIGWKKGMAQADAIYNTNLNRLDRDYKGMALYHALVAKGMIGKPVVVKADLGVTSNSSKTEMRVNDQVMQIQSSPVLNTKANSWKPILISQ